MSYKQKFHQGSYRHVRKLEHKGRIGHHTGQNITEHIVSMLDDTGKYRIIHGKLCVEDANLINVVKGRDVEEHWITIEEHNSKYYPKIQNPLNISAEKFLERRYGKRK